MMISSDLRSRAISTPAITSSSPPPTPAPDSVDLASPVESGVPHPSRPPADPKRRDWRDDIIYFAMTDRFQDGDPSNNFGVNKNDINRWHGGDIQGLIDKADYIRNTGATAVWITPPMAAQDTFVNTDGYHGYWPVDYYEIDKHLGDKAKFQEMIKTFHDKGMKVILDIPLNHVAWEHPFWKDPSKADMFHHNGDVTDWNNEWQQQNCSIFGLPDWAQENPKVEQYLIDVGKYWAGTGIDGFRLDAVRSVPQSFWKKFDEEMHKVAGPDFMLLGEYFHGDPTHVAPLQKDADMNGLVDYPVYYRIKESLAHGASMRELANGVSWANATYVNAPKMGAFPDNHDTQRFLTEADNDKNKLKLALAFVMTANRIPTIFYGTEQSFTSDKSGWSETSRKDMNFNQDPDMHAYFQKLTSIRNDCEPLRRGNLLEMWQDDQVYAYDRMSDKGEAIVVLNNSGGTQGRDIPLRAESKIAEGTVLKDLLSGQTATVHDHRIHSDVPSEGARIYIPDS